MQTLSKEAEKLFDEKFPNEISGYINKKGENVTLFNPAVDVKDLKDFIAQIEQSAIQTEREKITKEVDLIHNDLYEELEGTFGDRYSIDYKHGILRGYTLISRILHGDKALTESTE